MSSVFSVSREYVYTLELGGGGGGADICGRKSTAMAEAKTVGVAQRKAAPGWNFPKSRKYFYYTPEKLELYNLLSLL